MVDGCRRCRASRALILQPKVVKNKLMSFSDEKQVEKEKEETREEQENEENSQIEAEGS